MRRPIAYLPDSFRPIETPLIRLGCDYDGGYVVAQQAVERSTHLLSFGLETNWSFEADYLERKGSHADFTGIDAYDPTLTRWLLLKRTVRHVGRVVRRKRLGHVDSWWSYRRLFGSTRVAHHRQWVGKAGRANTVDFTTCLAGVPSSAAVFLKMDIEGSEYEILDQVIESSQRITGIAVELHAFQTAHRQYADLFDALHRHFRVAHVHVNNYGPLDDEGCPSCVEVSYVHDKLAHSQPAALSSAEQLDQPNCRDAPDYEVTYQAA